MQNHNRHQTHFSNDLQTLRYETKWENSILNIKITCIINILGFIKNSTVSSQPTTNTLQGWLTSPSLSNKSKTWQNLFHLFNVHWYKLLFLVLTTDILVWVKSPHSIYSQCWEISCLEGYAALKAFSPTCLHLAKWNSNFFCWKIWTSLF